MSTGGGVGLASGAAIGSRVATMGQRVAGACVGSGAGVHRVQLQTLSIKSGRKEHWSKGTRPISPAACNSPHLASGCPGNTKMASGWVTIFLSPQTEQPLGAIEGQLPIVTGGGAGVGSDTGTGVHRVQPQTSLMKSGRKEHCSKGMRPISPATCSSPHLTLGCPGNAKIASGSVMSRLLPHTEQPLSGIEGHNRMKSVGLSVGISSCRVGSGVGEAAGDAVNR